MDHFTSKSLRKWDCLLEPDGSEGRNNSRGEKFIFFVLFFFFLSQHKWIMKGKDEESHQERWDFSQDEKTFSFSYKAALRYTYLCFLGQAFSYLQFVQLVKFLTFPQEKICMEILCIKSLSKFTAKKNIISRLSAILSLHDLISPCGNLISTQLFLLPLQNFF